MASFIIIYHLETFPILNIFSIGNIDNDCDSRDPRYNFCFAGIDNWSRQIGFVEKIPVNKKNNFLYNTHVRSNKEFLFLSFLFRFAVKKRCETIFCGRRKYLMNDHHLEVALPFSSWLGWETAPKTYLSQREAKQRLIHKPFVASSQFF